MDVVCWPSLLRKVSTSFSILVSLVCMLYHSFYFTFSSCLPMTKPVLTYLCSCRLSSKIWPRVLRDVNLRVTALARPRSNCTVSNRPVLLSERVLQNYKPATVWRKFQRESKIGRGSQMGTWHQDWLADWLSVVMWLQLRLCKRRGLKNVVFCSFVEYQTMDEVQKTQ
jgi:hypothetical protein